MVVSGKDWEALIVVLAGEAIGERGGDDEKIGMVAVAHAFENRRIQYKSYS